MICEELIGGEEVVVVVVFSPFPMPYSSTEINYYNGR